MPGLRSLRNRLAVIFALIIIGAIGTIYLSVTPRLEASLTSQRLDQVRASATQYTPEVAGKLVSPREFYGDKEVPTLKDGPRSTRRASGPTATPPCGASPSASAPRSS